MKKAGLLLIAMFIAGCDTEARKQESGSDWLVGTWLPMDDATPYPTGCESDAVVVYDAEGKFFVEGLDGEWSLVGDELTETATNVYDEVTGPGVPPTLVSNIERVNSDQFRKSYADGESEMYRRCPSQ